MDVVLFVEPRLELDQRRDLLAVLGGVDERAHHRRVAGRAVQRLLDREHVGVGGRLLHELHDRVERLVRVVQQQIAFTNRREHVGLPDQPLGKRRRERRIVQIGLLDVDERPQALGAHHPVDFVTIAAVELERLAQLAAQVLRHRRLDLEPHRFAEPAFAQLRLDRAQQIVGLVLLQVEIGVARDAEEVGRRHAQAREQRLQVVRDDVFEHHEPALTGRRRVDRDEARQ